MCMENLRVKGAVMSFLKINKYHILSVFLILFFITGCKKPGKQEIKKNIRIRLEHDPQTLDPAYIVDVMGGNISAKLFNGLVRYDEKMAICGDLAKEYEISDDGKEYTFHLRKCVKFHCGREFTAKDVKYSFEYILSTEPISPRVWVLKKIEKAQDFIEKKTSHLEGIIIKDQYTILIKLDEPYAPFISLLTMPTSYIACRQCTHGGKQKGIYCGTGPYIFNLWKHDRTLKLIVNNDYFGKRPSGVENIDYYIIPEDFTALAELEKGRIDIMEIPVSMLGSLKKKKEKKFDIVEGVTLSTYYIGINCRRPYFKEKTLRNALSMCINKNDLIKYLMEDNVEKAQGPVPPGLNGHVSDETIPYDPEKARRVFASSSIKDINLKFYAKSSQQNTDIVSAIVNDMQKAGLKVEIELRDWAKFVESINQGEADLFFLSWWADIPDGIDFLSPVFHSENFGSAGNRAFFSNKEVDSLIDLAEKTTSSEERHKMYERIAQIIISESPWIFLWHKKSYYGVSKKISNYKVYPMYNIDKGENYKIIPASK